MLDLGFHSFSDYRALHAVTKMDHGAHKSFLLTSSPNVFDSLTVCLPVIIEAQLEIYACYIIRAPLAALVFPVDIFLSRLSRCWLDISLVAR